MVCCLDFVRLTLYHHPFPVSFRIWKTCFQQLSQVSSRTCTRKASCDRFLLGRRPHPGQLTLGACRLLRYDRPRCPQPCQHCWPLRVPSAFACDDTQPFFHPSLVASLAELPRTRDTRSLYSLETFSPRFLLRSISPVATPQTAPGGVAEWAPSCVSIPMTASPQWEWSSVAGGYPKTKLGSGCFSLTSGVNGQPFVCIASLCFVLGHFLWGVSRLFTHGFVSSVLINL